MQKLSKAACHSLHHFAPGVIILVRPRRGPGAGGTASEASYSHWQSTCGICYLVLIERVLSYRTSCERIKSPVFIGSQTVEDLAGSWWSMNI